MEEEKKKKIEEEEKKQHELEQKKTIKYTCFLNCWHGFFGKKLFEDKAECPFRYHKLCRKYLNNGIAVGGCKFGKNCIFGLHLTICDKSIKTRTCPNTKPGIKCK